MGVDPGEPDRHRRAGARRRRARDGKPVPDARRISAHRPPVPRGRGRQRRRRRRRDPRACALAAPVRRRSRCPRAHDSARRTRVRSDRRHAAVVPAADRLQGGLRRADGALDAAGPGSRPQRTRQSQLLRRRHAGPGRHGRSGDRGAQGDYDVAHARRALPGGDAVRGLRALDARRDPWADRARALAGQRGDALPAADCVRERRQPAARAHRVAPPRAGAAHGARCGPPADPPPVAGGSAGARRRRRRPGAVDRLGRHAAARARQRRGNSARRRRAHRLHRPRLRRRRHAGDDAGVQPDSGAARLDGRADRFAEGRRTERHDRQRPPADAQRARRRGDGAGRRSPRVGRARAAKPVGASTGAARLRSRERADATDRPAPLQLRRDPAGRTLLRAAGRARPAAARRLCRRRDPIAAAGRDDRRLGPRRGWLRGDAGEQRERGLAGGYRRSLRGARRAAGRRPVLHGSRPRGRDAGGARQRDDGEEVLAGRQPDRAPDPDGRRCQSPLDHRRRHRRRSAAQRARDVGEGEVLPPARAVLAVCGLRAAQHDARREDSGRPASGPAARSATRSLSSTRRCRLPPSGR